MTERRRRVGGERDEAAVVAEAAENDDGIDIEIEREGDRDMLVICSE